MTFTIEAMRSRSAAWGDVMRAMAVAFTIVLSVAFDIAAAADHDVSVTLYNNDLALVQDRRTINLTGGRQRVEFNAHRVFAPETIVESFPKLRLVSFSYVGDEGSLYLDAELAFAGRCHYGCGLFEFTKPV